MPMPNRKEPRVKNSEDRQPKQRPVAVREPAAQFVVSGTRPMVSKLATPGGSGTNRKNLHINQMLLN